MCIDHPFGLTFGARFGHFRRGAHRLLTAVLPEQHPCRNVASSLAGIAIVAALIVTATTALAADAGIPGLWKTFSDKTGKVESIVRIVEADGEIKGTIEKVFPAPNEDPSPKCDKCPAEFKGKPVAGLTFLWGFKREGARLSAGKILDPEEGEIYNCQIELADGGKSLKVRGYVGVPLFGRTQVWQRDGP
jgi:uncharacterized protein (DUF2147 family)